MSLVIDNDIKNEKSEDDSNFLLSCKKILAEFTENYWRFTSFNNLRSEKSYNFPNYMKPKTRVLFEQLFKFDDKFKGRCGSIWSWKYKQDNSDEFIFLYVVSFEDCESSNDTTSMKNKSILNCIENVSRRIGNVDDGEINEIIRNTRCYVSYLVAKEISNLKIFLRWTEASEYLSNKFNNDVKIDSLRIILNNKFKRNKVSSKK